MKTVVALLLGIFLGAAGGWYVGYTRPVNDANREARRYLASMEDDDCKTAIFGLHAIPLVESGETTKAIRWLAKPVGTYYRVYAHRAGTNELRLSMKSQIETLAKSNAIVAAELRQPNNNAQVDAGVNTAK